MKELVPFLVGLLGAGLAMLVWREQFRAFADRLTPSLLSSMRQVWSVWADIGVTQPWVGLCGDRIAIACVQQRPADATQVAALVEIGSTLAAARG
jgi:hypothetical protein